MINQTTQKTLADLQAQIDRYDPEQCFGVPLDELRNNYEACKEVANTLTYKEMRLITLLRGCRRGDRQRFLTAAEKLYKALRDCDALCEPTPPKKTD